MGKSQILKNICSFNFFWNGPDPAQISGLGLTRPKTKKAGYCARTVTSLLTICCRMWIIHVLRVNAGRGWARRNKPGQQEVTWGGVEAVLLVAAVVLLRWRDCGGGQSFSFLFLSLLCFFFFFPFCSFFLSRFSPLLCSLVSLFFFFFSVFFLLSLSLTLFFFFFSNLLFLSRSLFFCVSFLPCIYKGEKEIYTPAQSMAQGCRVDGAATVQPPLYHPRDTSPPLTLTRGKLCRWRVPGRHLFGSSGELCEWCM